MYPDGQAIHFGSPPLMLTALSSHFVASAKPAHRSIKYIVI
jgi:hypothetical protein